MQERNDLILYANQTLFIEGKRWATQNAAKQAIQQKLGTSKMRDLRNMVKNYWA